jgi:hypothetical protein
MQLMSYLMIKPTINDYYDFITFLLKLKCINVDTYMYILATMSLKCEELEHDYVAWNSDHIVINMV